MSKTQKSSSSSSRSSSGSSSRSSSSVSMSSAGHRDHMDIKILVGILYHLLVILYLVNLENEACNCILDWRHNYLKYFSSVLVVVGIITLFIDLSKSHLASLLKLVLCVGSLVNIYCLFTYIGDLDATNCKCARDKQRTMHYFLYIWRWVLVISLVFAVICAVIGDCVHHK